MGQMGLIGHMGQVMRWLKYVKIEDKRFARDAFFDMLMAYGKKTT